MAVRFLQAPGGQRGTWAKWVGITTLLLVATGLFNFINNVKTYEIATSYHMLVGLKILVALVVFFLAAVLAGRSMMAERFRTNMRFWLSVCLVAGIITVLIGSVMRTYPREPKPIAGPTLIDSSIIAGNTANTSPDIACPGSVTANHSALGNHAGLSIAGANNLPAGLDLKPLPC